MALRRHFVLNLRRLLLSAIALALPAPAIAQPGPEWAALQWHLWRIETDGTGLRALDETRGTRCGSPVWSPDGTKIAYDVSDSDTNIEIFAIGADGSERRLIGKGAIPCWSTDGKLFYFQHAGKTVMNVDGTGREILPGFGFSLRCVPGKNRVITVAGGGFAVFDLTSGEERLVSVGPHIVQHGYDISADGRKICFGSKTSGLCVATFDEDFQHAKVEQLVDEGIGYHASWSPDDKRIVFAWQKHPADTTQIYFYDTESRGEPTLVPGLDLSRSNVNPNWSPDGKTIVFSRAVPF
jgi:WD40 repeat protein